LLNIGDIFHFRAENNELFTMNYSIATGNSQNSLVKGAYRHLMTQNSLIYSRNFNGAAERNEKPRWALGYGIEKYIYTPKMGIPSHIRFINYGIQFMHVNWGKEIEKELSLLTRLRFVVGAKPPRRFGPLSSFYFYGGLTLNTFVHTNERNYAPEIGSLGSFSVNDGHRANVWIGYVLGVHYW